MDLFKLMGTIVINGSEKARSDISSVGESAQSTADTISRSNRNIDSSNSSTGSSWSKMKSAVNEYKSQGMSTSQAWRQATLDMKSSTAEAESGMVGSFGKIGMAIGTIMTTTAIVGFGQQCLQAAADASAMESQFTQVFGKLEGKAKESLTGIADEAGISENRLKGSFTQIAAFAKTTGMDTEDALGLSERAMIAVADSAAFYDRSIEDTTESLQSFLKGNYENDAALGLSCTETTRNAAANKLYGKSFKDLSESQKQLTLLKMVEDANKASGALGQAARESETWSNVTGNLKQSFKDLLAVIGSTVLPTATGVITKMSGAVEGLIEKTKSAIEWTKTHKEEMKLIGIAFATVGAAIAGYNIYVNSATIATKAYTLAQKLATLATTAFGSVMAFLTSPVTLVILAIGALVAAVVVMYNKFDWFKAIVDKVKDSMVNGWNKIKESVSGAIDELKARLAPLVDAIKVNLVGAFNDFRDRANAAKDKLAELMQKFKPVVDIISGAFSSGMSSASDSFDKFKSKIGDLAEGALTKLNNGITIAREGFQKFADFAGRLWNNLDPLVTLIRDNLVNSLQNLKEPIETIKQAFSTIGDTIFNHLLPALRDMLMPVWESLKSALSGVAGIMGGAFVGALGLAIGAISGIVKAISGFAKAISGIVEIVANVFKLIVGIFTLNGEQCKEALQGIWDGVCKVFGGLWDAVSGFLKGFVDGVVGFFKGLWDTLVGHSIVPDTIDGIVDCFAGLWGKVKGLVSSFKNGVVNAFNNVKEKTISAFNSAKDKAVSAFNNMKSKVSSTASNIKSKVSSSWDSLKSKTSSAFETAKSKASSAFSTMKSKVTSYASSMASSAGSKFSSMKSKISSAVDSAKNKTSSAFSTMKSKISSALSGAYSTVSSKFGSIKSKISSVMNSAKSLVTSAVSKMKSAFNFKWSLPKLKLPHISVSGGKAPYGIGGAGSLPKFSIEWYKKAMNNPMIVTKPTVFDFDATTGKAKGAGDAGSELVGGTTAVKRMIESAVASQNDALVYYLKKIIEILANFFPQVLEEMERPLCLDPYSAAAAMAVPMDRELGKIRAGKERGR